MSNTPRNFAGTADYLGSEAQLRNLVIDKIAKIYSLYGFIPLETSIIEREEVFRAAGADDTIASRFKLKLPLSGPQAGLRFDHTVPLASYMAFNDTNVQKPFRRYSIGPVFRNESGAGAGRLSQFVQCDFDTVGSSNPLVDAEVVAVTYNVLRSLGFSDELFMISINNRRLLNALVSYLGIDSVNSDQAFQIIRAWDKLDKKSLGEIFQTDVYPNFEASIAQAFYRFTAELVEAVSAGESESFMRIIAESNELVASSFNQIEELLNLVEVMGVPQSVFKFDPLLARGLSYYTGPIFETKVVGISGSIAGGGRYDNLIKHLGGPDMPASGSSFGLERLIFVMKELGLTNSLVSQSGLDFFVTIFSPNELNASVNLARQIRELTNCSVELYNGDTRRLAKQMDFANQRGARYTLIIGPSELQNSQVTVKDMFTGNQNLMNIDDLLSWISKSFD